jgi:hypothetical protein
MAAKKTTDTPSGKSDTDINLRCLAYQRSIEFMVGTRDKNNTPTIEEVLQHAEKIATFLINGKVDTTRVTN